jgi:hypothetical protein
LNLQNSICKGLSPATGKSWLWKAKGKVSNKRGGGGGRRNDRGDRGDRGGGGGGGQFKKKDTEQLWDFTKGKVDYQK